MRSLALLLGCLLLGVPVCVYIIRFVIFSEGIPGFIDPPPKKRRALATAGAGGAVGAAVEIPAPESRTAPTPSVADEPATEAEAEAEVVQQAVSTSAESATE